MWNIFLCAYLHLHIFFGEGSIQILCPFLIELFFFLLMNYQSLLYSWNTRPLSDPCFYGISFFILLPLLICDFLFKVQF